MFVVVAVILVLRLTMSILELRMTLFIIKDVFLDNGLFHTVFFIFFIRGLPPSSDLNLVFSSRTVKN